LGTLSRGMDRRLGLASALLSDPHTLVLDNPADGLSPREARWLHGILRAHAAQGGTVLFTTDDPKEAARTADRVVTLERGRLVADQESTDFARTRLRPRVVVRSPHAARLGALLTKEARTTQRSVEVVREEGNRLSVYGSTCADVGEAAFRNGILVHQLADEVGDMGPVSVRPSEMGAQVSDAPDAEEERPSEDAHESRTLEDADGSRTQERRPAAMPAANGLSPLPPPIAVRHVPSPLRPLRYELRRSAGVGTGYLVTAVVLVTSALLSVLLARIGHTPQQRLLAAWPQELPLPPAALGAGLLGALAFGEEFRHPALATDRGTVPRRLGLLTAKLLVASAIALLLAVLAVGCDLEMLYLVYGRELTSVPADWLSLSGPSPAAGRAALHPVPVPVLPLVHTDSQAPSVRTAAGFSERLRELVLVQWPFGGGRYLAAAVEVLVQPVGGALTLSLTALLCAYLLTTLRSRVR
ncbi:ABC transporter ATP-binding protein, partial [Streptomyces sp. NPDC127574]|uniref:ABC transporter ATP-binding protein n=1 Tax=Streptomyces sp. NPDC127574 TaxID=3345401 RepID=UPI00363D5A6A